MSDKTSILNVDNTKAGMQGIDADKINSIIMEASKNSKFHNRQLKRQEEIERKISKRLAKMDSFTEDEIKAAEIKADKILSQYKENYDTSRTIVHIDLDAFYAAVEIRDNPSLENIPIAVGSLSMLATSNYEARKYGVRAAMPGFIAKKLCPELTIITPDFEKYKAASKTIMNIIALYDPNYLAYGLDEAYLDITDHLKERQYKNDSTRSFPLQADESTHITFGIDAIECVKEIRHRIFITTGLTASAGIACNRRLAKLCSDVNKPNGQFFLYPDEKTILEFIGQLEVKKIKGIGKVSASLLEGIGIKKCSDIFEKRGILYLTEYPSFFHFLMQVCIGYGSSNVDAFDEDNQKSIGHESTFKSTNSFEELQCICGELANSVEKSLKKAQKLAGKLVLKIKTAEFMVFSKSKTLNTLSDSSTTFFKYAVKALKEEMERLNWPLLRLIGIRVADLKNKSLLNDFFNVRFDKAAAASVSSLSSHTQFDVQVKNVDTTHETPRCPLCNENLIDLDNSLLNEHIDECLTKATIASDDDLFNNIQRPVKKLSDTKKFRPSKKLKTSRLSEDLSEFKLDRFFKK